jgi:ThiF family protein
MHSGSLNGAAKRENARTLANALGITPDAASTVLDACVAVTANADDIMACNIANDVVTLLSRTVSHVTPNILDEVASDEVSLDRVAVEVVFGAASAKTGSPVVRVCISPQALTIERATPGNDVPREPCAIVPRLLGRLAACYVSSAAAHSVIAATRLAEMPNPFELYFSELGVTFEQLTARIDLGHAYLAGAGAIGNAFLWAAEHVDLCGTLDIADDDFVSDGNLNRQILFEPDDIGLPKVERLVARASARTPNLTLRARPKRLQNLEERNDGPWLKRLIVAVDSRRARRKLQSELPGEVFDASTTDIREVVVHHNKQPATAACMACIYAPNHAEYTRERHIAEALGVGVDAVRSERISPQDAEQIVLRYPKLSSDVIVGLAYDSLFKQLCGEGQLQTAGGEGVLAPFAFVSCLAGTLLVIEVIRRLTPDTAVADDNYWRVSAWHPPLSRSRIRRQRELQCEVCGDEVRSEVIRELWGEQPR